MDVLVQPLNTFNEILVEDDYSVRMLHEFGDKSEYMDSEKIGELWNNFKRHDVLFNDEIKGNAEAFIDIMMDPRSVWMEIYSLSKEVPVGVFSISKVIPGFDGWAHFGFWDGKGRGKEDLSLRTARWVFDRYKLHRMSVEVPVNQSGTIRFIHRLGFSEEGIRREGTVRHGKWIDLLNFGLLRSELEEITDG